MTNITITVTIHDNRGNEASSTQNVVMRPMTSQHTMGPQSCLAVEVWGAPGCEFAVSGLTYETRTDSALSGVRPTQDKGEVRVHDQQGLLAVITISSSSAAGGIVTIQAGGRIVQTPGDYWG